MSMQNFKDKIIELTKYKKVDSSSQHGPGFFSIEDLEDDDATGDDDDIEINLRNSHSKTSSSSSDDQFHNQETTSFHNLSIYSIWSTLTFSWMQDLLKKGNEKPLTVDDLDELPDVDRSEMVYRRFSNVWNKQLKENSSPSLVWAFGIAFGKPFLAAGLLKLIYDSSAFSGPLLLNALIKFLSDPSQPLSKGLLYVFILFFANFLMSLCLRQYFW
jgi:hypothetical protein